MTWRAGLLGLMLGLVGGVCSISAGQKAASTVVASRHAQFTHLLERVVDTEGDVDYRALQAQAQSIAAP